VIITTFVGLAALVVGLLIGWPVLVALSAIFVLVQVMMLTAAWRNGSRTSAADARAERPQSASSASAAIMGFENSFTPQTLPSRNRQRAM